jgi:spore protease
VGTYVTLTLDALTRREEDAFGRTAHAIARELRTLLEGLPARAPVLVAGLGNRAITPDAIGPLVHGHTVVTRHLVESVPEHFSHYRPVCVLIPGVLASTGVESAEITSALTQRVKPAAVLVIDALAARSCRRLGTTVQLSNRGVMPGSGVGNHRKSIDHHSMGAPVFTFGIPTVVSSAALVREAVTEAGLDSDAEARIGELAEAEECFVSPKNCDTIVAEGATLFADAIQQAFRL